MRTIAFLSLAACHSDYEVVSKPVDVDPGEVTECGFTRVDNPDSSPTDFYRYDCNPVFSTTGEDWVETIGSTAFAVTDVVGHPFYQMWYTGGPSEETFGQYGLGYAISASGTHWEPHPSNPLLTEPDSAEWDADNMDAMQVVWDPRRETYVMIYQGYHIAAGDWGMGVASSPDGVSWSKSEANPVLDLTKASNGVRTWCWPLGLTLDATEGYDGYIAGTTSNNDAACEVFQLQANDIDSWSGTSEKVLARGDPGAWDDQGFISIAIARLSGTWYLFYVGFGDWDVYDGYQSTKNQYLGWATSTDGRTWTKKPARIPIQMTEDGQVGAVAARTVGRRIHLWVTDTYDGAGAVGLFLFDPFREDER